MRTGPRNVDWQRDSPFSNQGMEGGGYAHHAGLSSLGVPGVPWHTQILCRLVNPISTRVDRLCPPNYYWHTQIFRPSDGPAVLIKVNQRTAFFGFEMALKNFIAPYLKINKYCPS